MKNIYLMSAWKSSGKSKRVKVAVRTFERLLRNYTVKR